jgi:hypothetical protein
MNPAAASWCTEMVAISFCLARSASSIPMSPCPHSVTT